MPTDTEWAWVAGLLEGEGCFGVYKGTRHTNGKPYENLVLQVRMSDKDVLEKLHRLVQAGTLRESPLHEDMLGNKPMWVWRTGASEAVERILSICLPWFGQRRTAKAKEVLAVIEKRKSRR